MSQITTPVIQPRYRQSAWSLLMTNRLAALGLAILLVIMLSALLAPWLPLPDPDKTDLINRLLPVFLRVMCWEPTILGVIFCHGYYGEHGYHCLWGSLRR